MSWSATLKWLRDIFVFESSARSPTIFSPLIFSLIHKLITSSLPLTFPPSYPPSLIRSLSSLPPSLHYRAPARLSRLHAWNGKQRRHFPVPQGWNLGRRTGSRSVTLKDFYHILIILFSFVYCIFIFVNMSMLIFIFMFINMPIFNLSFFPFFSHFS